MNMPKCNLRLLMLHEFKIGQVTSGTSTNINRAWGEGPTSVRKQFRKFCSGDETLEDEEGIGRACSLDNEQLQAVVELKSR